jgi:hypothetical protein
MMMWSVIVLFVTIVLSVMIYQVCTFPGQVVNGSIEEFQRFFYNNFAISNAISTYPWITLHLVSTIVTAFAIWKIVSITRRLEQCKVNNRTMMLHISILVIQNVVLVLCFVFGDFMFIFNAQGYEKILIGRLDTPLTYVDALIELLICYICWTMGSSS